jgi:eukaryotic-like serine/threonine-protein kinase
VCRTQLGIGEIGDFRLLREVGRGGMGVVYEAEQISLRRRVALKILPFAAAIDPRRLQRFKTEALTAAQVQHEKIVPVHAVGCEHRGHSYRGAGAAMEGDGRRADPGHVERLPHAVPDAARPEADVPLKVARGAGTRVHRKNLTTGARYEPLDRIST